MLVIIATEAMAFGVSSIAPIGNHAVGPPEAESARTIAGKGVPKSGPEGARPDGPAGTQSAAGKKTSRRWTRLLSGSVRLAG
ncbi:hypothetical protein RNZ50_03020 [Paracoccaceae bacterium Fryx2]|nr:hypothetical protein [Paracoccaceae bacterium Fryx2]